MADPSKYILKVTGGPSYDQQSEIKVNTSTHLCISTDKLDSRVYVRVKDFRGLPRSSPATCDYFSHSSHLSDRYSISFTFVPKVNINGNDLVFGNDFDHPIRDKLPPLFDKAFSIVKSWIDPGLYGDPYADEPYLYGPLLSSVNVLRIGEKSNSKDDTPTVDADETQNSGPIVEEGADGEAAEGIRHDNGMPSAHAARQKYYLNEQKRSEFEFEAGRTYACDFSNGYLDFNDFALRLPFGVRLNILGNWDGQPLRYVLRDRKTNDLLFVVNFALIPLDDEAEDHLTEGKVQSDAQMPEINATENDDLD